jgi:hypothetical protein
MGIADEEKTRTSGSGVGSTALKVAAAAAATGAATFAVRKVRSHGDRESWSEDRAGSREGSSAKKNGNGQSLLASAAATGWEAASETLVPLAEDAAEAAGRCLATRGPDVVREHIVPKFIEGFNEAKGAKERPG